MIVAVPDLACSQAASSSLPCAKLQTEPVTCMYTTKHTKAFDPEHEPRSDSGVGAVRKDGNIAFADQ